MLYHCEEGECVVRLHEGPECPLCGADSTSAYEMEDRRAESLAAAGEEWHAHGSPDDASHDPVTGWSEYDYPSRGSARNDAGEPYLD